MRAYVCVRACVCVCVCVGGVTIRLNFGCKARRQGTTVGAELDRMWPSRLHRLCESSGVRQCVGIMSAKVLMQCYSIKSSLSPPSSLLHFPSSPRSVAPTLSPASGPPSSSTRPAHFGLGSHHGPAQPVCHELAEGLPVQTTSPFNRADSAHSLSVQPGCDNLVSVYAQTEVGPASTVRPVGCDLLAAPPAAVHALPGPRRLDWPIVSFRNLV